jgi:hypothetical protein
MDFPHSGDLMVISTVYPDGTVAALEELIGSHGGLGGEQTDAFIFHPAQMDVPATRNSIDVFHILNARRGLPAPPFVPEEIEPASKDQWAWSNLSAGLSKVNIWMGRLARALVLDRTAYGEVAADRLMTGPGLLIGLLFSVLAGLTRLDRASIWSEVLSSVVTFFVTAFVIYFAGRLLTRKGYYTRTLRTLGFAHVMMIFSLLRLSPLTAPIADILMVLAGFVATWIAAAEAHQTSGWRTLALPLLWLVSLVLLPLILLVLFGGLVFSIESILDQLGLMP